MLIIFITNAFALIANIANIVTTVPTITTILYYINHTHEHIKLKIIVLFLNVYQGNPKPYQLQ